MNSPVELVQKRIRKGARSCIECRVRKVRCTYTTPETTTCEYCKTHGRVCTPQTVRKPRSSHRSVPRDLKPDDRLARLELQIARLAGQVHKSGPSALINIERNEDHDDDDNDESHQLLTATTPPTHLQLIFDNASISKDATNETITDRAAQRMSHVRTRLQQLMPSKEDVISIAQSAIPWMTLYHSYFPSSHIFSQPDDLIDKYDEMMDPGTRPTAVAACLTLLAITVLQLIRAGAVEEWTSIKDPSQFVRKVTTTVQNLVVADNELAGTVEGLETIVLYVRLQLGRGDIRDMWLTLRRALALAEFTGLQKLAAATHLDPDSCTKAKLALFDAICATDRMLSMLFNLPSATAHYDLPSKQLINDDGTISTSAYMLELAKIAISVQDVDEELSLAKPFDEVYQKILTADTLLRRLAGQTLSRWRQTPDDRLQACDLAQLLHYYVTVRIHLHSLTRPDPYRQYAYSRTTCIEACQKTIRQFIVLRHNLPKGFFLTRLCQMEVFTASIVLLLSRQHTAEMNGSAAESEEQMILVSQVIHGLEADARSGGGDFAVQGAAALRALQGWLQTPDSLSETLTLRIPMLGKVNIGKANRLDRNTEHSNKQEVSTRQDQAVQNHNVETMAQNQPRMDDQQQWSHLAASDQDFLSWDLELGMTNFLDDSYFVQDFDMMA